MLAPSALDGGVTHLTIAASTSDGAFVRSSLDASANRGQIAANKASSMRREKGRGGEKERPSRTIARSRPAPECTRLNYVIICVRPGRDANDKIPRARPRSFALCMSGRGRARARVRPFCVMRQRAKRKFCRAGRPRAFDYTTSLPPAAIHPA